MSVIVMGMEMPHKCLECRLNTDEIACTAATLEQSKEAYYEAKKNGTSHEEEMFKICPLRPLPEKHGRLGDLDELKISFADSINECKKWIKELEENGDNETLVLANQAFCTFVEAALRLKSIPTIVESEGKE